MNWIADAGHLRFWLVLSLLSLAMFSAHAQSSDRYKKWLDEDVRWIITPQERAAFTKLTGDSQRDEFVVAFWELRNPTPGGAENSFKREHYRRLAYANVHFAFAEKDRAVPGWKSDRGRIYIVFGPPDAIDFHPSGQYQRASGARTSTLPYEVWSYRSIQGFGENVTVRFVDACHCGDYRQMSAASDDHELPLPTSPDD